VSEGLSIGDLRERLTLHEPVRTPDGAGGFSESWNMAGTYWARVVPIAAGETATADRLISPERHRVEVRAPNPVRAGWRVFWRGRWRRVESVQAGERPGDRIILIMAEISS